MDLHEMAAGLQYIPGDSIGITKGHWYLPVEYTPHNRNMPEQPMSLSSSPVWSFLQTSLDTLAKFWTSIFSIIQLPNAVFTNIAALVAVGLFCRYLCALSRSTETSRITGAQIERERQAELARRDAELKCLDAANKAQVVTISALEDKKIAAEQKFEEMNGILKWYLVNYPVIEGANARFKEQSVHDEQKFVISQADLQESLQENMSLRGRLHRLTTSSPSPSDVGLPGGTINAEDPKENSRLKAELAATEAQKNIIIADKNNAESERDLAKSETKKLIEDCERQAENLKSISTVLNTEKSDLRRTNEELVSTVDHLNGKIKYLEGANTVKDEEFKTLAVQGEQLDQTRNRLQSTESKVGELGKALEDSKEEIKLALKNASTSSAENDSLLRVKDCRINELEGQVDTLQQRNTQPNAGNAELLSAYATMTQQVEDSKREFAAATEDWTIAETKYKDSIETTRAELQARTEELEGYKKGWRHEREWHDCLQKYVNDLRVVLEGVMGELNVMGNLNNAEGVDQAGHALKHQIGESKSHYDQKLKEVEYIKKQRDELQTFKTWAESALKTAGHHNDSTEALRKANEARRILGEEIVKVKNENGNLRMRNEALRKGLKSTKEESEGSQKNNETYTKRIQGLQNQLAELQKNCDKLRVDVANLQQLKGKYEQEVQELQERKKLLEKQRKDLVRDKYKSGTGSPSSGPNAEKRSHEDADAAEDEEGCRSNKQQRQNFESKSAD
ncbi:MAG: hypothetical protein Q9186_005048 [Xanthomendoza sp. 1 TL-2023]